MISFKNWLEMSSLRDLLNVPQSPVHHPEGDVFTHTRMVRQSMDRAIEVLKEAQKDSNSAFSKLNLSLTPDEINILRLAGWMHDIGKVGATAWTTDTEDRIPWTELPDEPDLPGKGWQSIGHERPEIFEPEMQKLGPHWQKMYKKADEKDRQDLWFIIQNHMTLNKKGFGKHGFDWVDDNGKYKNIRRVKLLLILILMDRLGRGETVDKWDDVPSTLKQMQKTADDKMRKIAYLRHREEEQAELKLAIDTPEKMIQWWHKLGKPPHALPGALKGKFDLSDEEIQDLI
jgi:hypothetical protein